MNDYLQFLTTRLALLRGWYAALSSRDQRAVIVLGVFFSIMFLFYGVAQPSLRWRNEARARYLAAAQDRAWVEKHRGALAALPARPAAGFPESLASAAGEVARARGLTLRRFEPEGDLALRVWMDAVPFERALAWLEEMKSAHGAEVVMIEVTRAGTVGLVDVSLTLERRG